MAKMFPVWPSVGPITSKDVKRLAFFGLILFYGCFSSPTPIRLGHVEFIVGILLVLCIGPARALKVLRVPRPATLWRFAGWLFLLYGLTVPLITGIASGHDPALVMRDIIPFLFLLLPLFLCPLIEGDTDAIKIFTTCTAAAGLIFALRLLIPSFVAHSHAGLSALPEADPLYLANAPTVQLAAMLGLGLTGQRLMAGWLNPRSWALTLLLALAGFCCLTAMAAVMQRATIGLACGGLLLLLGIASVRNPMRALIPLGAGFIAIALFWASLSAIAGHLSEKTMLVGFNNRPQEAAVVFHAVGHHALSVLFGLGWGQTISSPAVGDVTVNYTHTLVTALWLKTGIVGVLLAYSYFTGLALGLWRILWRHPVVAVAITVPFLTDITLYASYKSLDFGLLLTLIPLWAGSGQKLRRSASLVYAKADPIIA